MYASLLVSIAEHRRGDTGRALGRVFEVGVLLLQLLRSNVYYRAAPNPDPKRRSIRRIAALYLVLSFAGGRMLRNLLLFEGWHIGQGTSQRPSAVWESWRSTAAGAPAGHSRQKLVQSCIEVLRIVEVG